MIKEALSLAQSIQSYITHTFNATTLGLAVKLHHRTGSKEIVSVLHEYGYISTYEEVLRFRDSAAKYTADEGFTAQGLKRDGKPISAWIDNYDLQVYTPNGNRETHALAVEFTQPSDSLSDSDDDENMPEIPRLSRGDMKTLQLSEMSGVVFEHYQGPPKPLPPNVPSQNIGIEFTEIFKKI